MTLPTCRSLRSGTLAELVVCTTAAKAEVPPPALGHVRFHQQISQTSGGLSGTLCDRGGFSVAAPANLDGDGNKEGILRQRKLVAYLLGLVMALAIEAPGVAQGNLDLHRDAEASVPLVASERELSGAAVESKRVGGIFTPVVVPAAAFLRDGFRPTSSVFSFFTGRLTGNSMGYGCSMAPVYLPDGATITAVTLIGIDDDPGYDVRMILRKLDNFSGQTSELVLLVTTGTPGFAEVTIAAINNPNVVHPDHSLYLTTCLRSQNVELIAVRIHFTSTISS